MSLKCRIIKLQYFLGWTEAELRECAVSSKDAVSELMVSIDGHAINDSQLRAYRVELPLFNITLPGGYIYGLDEDSPRAVSDGYWAFLPPLTPGEPQINFRGTTRLHVCEHQQFCDRVKVQYHKNTLKMKICLYSSRMRIVYFLNVM